MNKKIFNWIFFVIILLIVVAIVIKNWGLIKGLFGGGNKCTDADSNFECINKRGGVPSATFKGSLDYPNGEKGSFRFFTNNRVAEIGSSPELKGSYDKKEITWDDGRTTTLKEVFSKNKDK